MAEALAALGDDVTVWTVGRSPDDHFFRPVHPAVNVRIVPCPSVGDDVGRRVRASIDAMAAALSAANGRADVVHAQDCITANAASRCVRTVHHLDTFNTPELVTCHERAIRTPIAHVCVSRGVAGELADGWGLSATVIPSGVDADRFASAAGSPAAAAWQARIARPYVLSVGGIEPRKGTLDLIAAYAQLRSSHPDVGLVIAGGETLFDYRSYRAEVDRRCAELGVEPVVLGPVEHDELPALMAGAAAFAFPSTKEGFGLAAMEALAAGVPVVMRDLPVLREVFAGAARFTSSPEQCAAALVAAIDGDSADLTARGRALAARHTWASAAEAHRSLYRRLPPRPIGRFGFG